MPRKLNLKLAGKDGNAFFLLGYFQSEARRRGWTEEEINEIRKRATSGDYNNLLRVLMSI